MLPWGLVAEKASWYVANQWRGAQESCRFLEKGWWAANSSSNTDAFIEGAGLERFPILIVDSIQITTHCHHVWKSDNNVISFCNPWMKCNVPEWNVMSQNLNSDVSFHKYLPISYAAKGLALRFLFEYIWEDCFPTHLIISHITFSVVSVDNYC